ncbi:MAG: recombinase, partial [Bacilli bacterium]|nr:recombinase [Bacilli bacterium]
LVYCSKCGRSMRFQKTYNRPFNSLLCTMHNCETRGARFELVEQKLLEALGEYLDRMILDQEMSAEQELPTNPFLDVLNTRVETLVKELAEVTTQKDKLHDFLERGIYDVDTFLDREKTLTSRIERIQAEITTSRAELDALTSTKDKRETMITDITRVLDVYREAENVEEKNYLLRKVIEKVVYTRDKGWTRTDMFELDIQLRYQ